MTREVALLACAGLLNSLIGVSAQAPVAPPPVRPGTPPADVRAGNAIVTGRVLSDTDTPVPAALVALSVGAASRPDSPRVLTDAQGRYFFSGITAGTYNLTVTKPGWLPGAFGRGRPGGNSMPIAIAEGQRQGDVDLHMWRAAVIAGRVTEAGGDPMVAVDVRAFRLTYQAGHAQPEFVTRARTDDRGLYRFSSLDPGGYLICVPATVTSGPSGFAGVISAQDHVPHAYLQTMTEVGTAPMTFVSSEGASSGVTGSDRWSISSILDMPASPPATGPWLTYPTTCAPGALTRSAATIVRAVPGREPASVAITMRLTPTYQVSGTLTAPDGPAAYHAVHLIATDTADAPMIDTSTAITDGSGAFVFFGVPPGSYVARVVRTPWPGGGAQLATSGGTGAIPHVVTMSSGPNTAPAVSAEPLLYASQPVTVADHDVRDLGILLRAGVRVSGRLEFDGDAPRPASTLLERLQIFLEPAHGQQYQNVTPGLATATGQFATSSTLPGPYLIRAAAPTGWRLQTAMVRGRDASETAIDLQSDLEDVVLVFTDKQTTIAGTVQFGSGVTLVPAVVILFPIDKQGWTDYGRNSRRVRSTGVSPTGTFTMPAPPDGDYYLVAIADADAADWSNPAVLERLTTLADRIQVRGGQSLTHALGLRRLR